MGSHRVGKLYIELDLDKTRYMRSQQTLVKEAKSGAKVLETNFHKLGIKSGATFDLMRSQAQANFNAIKKSGRVTTDDLIRAEKAKAAKIKQINDQQYGRHESMLKKMGTNWKMYAVMATAAMGLAMRKILVDYAEFEVSLNRLGNVSNETLDSMRMKILAIEPALGSVTELTRGYYQVLSAGVTDADRSMELLRVSAKISKEAIIDQAAAVKGLAAVMGTYSTELKSATDAADLLYTIERSGITTVEELTPLIGNLANMSKAVGLSANEMAGALAQVTTTGAGTSESVTQLQSLLTALSKKFTLLPDSIQKYGSSLKAVKALGFQGVLKEIWQATDGNSTALIKMLGRQEAYLALLQLSKNEFSDYSGRLEGMTNKVGAFADAWKRYSVTLTAVWEEFQNTVGREAVLLGEELAPAIKKVVGEMSSWIQQNRELIGQNVEEAIDDIGTSLKAIVSIYSALPDGVVGAAGVGIVTRILTGSTPIGRAAFALIFFNEQLKITGNSLEDVVKTSESAWKNIENIWDVITGKRDWHTGALKGNVFEDLHAGTIDVENELGSLNETIEDTTKVMTKGTKATEEHALTAKEAAKQVKALAAAIAEANEEVESGLYIGEWEMISSGMFAGYEYAAQNIEMTWEEMQADIAAVTKKTTKDTTKYVETLWDKALDRVEMSLADTFYDEFKVTLDDSLSLFEGFLNSMIRMLSEKAAAMTMFDLFGTATGSGKPEGWGGLLDILSGSGSDGGGSGIMDILGLGNSAYSMTSGKSLITTITDSIMDYLGLGSGMTAYAGIGASSVAEATTLAGMGLGGAGGSGAIAGGSGASAGLYGGIAAAIWAVVNMMFAHQYETSGGPSKLGTTTKLHASADPNRLLSGDMVSAVVTGGQWDEAHAKAGTDRIAGMIADTLDMYNVLWSNLSDQSKAAMKEAFDKAGFKLEGLQLNVMQEAAGGIPTYASIVRNTPNEISTKEWGTIGGKLGSKGLGGLDEVMKDAIIASFEDGGKLTGRALADIMNVEFEALQQAFDEGGWMVGLGLNNFIDSINKAYEGGYDLLTDRKTNTIPEAFKQVFGDYFEAYIEEGLEGIKGKDVFGFMTDEIQAAVEGLTKEGFIDNINGFTDAFVENVYQVERAGKIWESLNAFVGRATDEITAYEKAATEAQIQVTAYVAKLAEFGVELTDTEVADKAKEILESITDGINDLESAVEPLGQMGQMVAALNGQFDAYLTLLEEYGVALEKITELEELRLEATERLWEEYKAAIGLLGDDYLENLKLDEIADKYKKFGLTFEEMLDWASDATLADVKAIAEALGIDWTEIADDIGFLAGAIDTLGDVAEDATKSIEDAQWALLGTTQGGNIGRIEEKYGLGAGTITADWFDDIFDWFTTAKTSEIESFADAMGVSVSDFLSDMVYLNDAFQEVGDSVEDVANDIENYAQQIRDVLSAGGPGGSSASASAAGLWSQITSMQGATHTGESLLSMSQILVKWYDAAVREAEEKARLLDEEKRMNEQYLDRLSSLISQIDDTIRNIKYSDLNVSLPSQKAVSAGLDYNILLGEAQTGGVAEVQAYLGFVSTYLKQQQNELKSSQAYQGTPDSVYEKTMADMKAIKSRAEAGGYEAAILAELTGGFEKTEVVLTDINDNFAEMESWILTALQGLSDLNVVLEIIWSEMSGSDVILALKDLLERYGWEDTIVITFMTELAANFTGTFEERMAILGFVSGSSGWNSTATLILLSSEDFWRDNTWKQNMELLGFMLEEGVGWNSKAMLAFISNESAWSSTTFEQAMAGLKYVSKETGWTSKATLAWISNEGAWSSLSFEEAVETFNFINNATGWESKATLAWISNEGAWSSTSFEQATESLKYVSKETGWTSKATLAWISNEGAWSSTSFEQAVENFHFINNANGWDSKATLAWISNETAWSSATIDQSLEAFKYLGVNAGWDSKATLAWVSNLSAQGNVSWDALQTLLDTYGVPRTIIETLQAEYEQTSTSPWASWSAMETALQTIGVGATGVAAIEAEYLTGDLTIDEFKTLLKAEGFTTSDILKITNELTGNVGVALSEVDIWKTQVGLLVGILQNTAIIAMATGGGGQSLGTVAGYFDFPTGWSLGEGAYTAQTTSPFGTGVGTGSVGTCNFPAGVDVWERSLVVVQKGAGNFYSFVTRDLLAIATATADFRDKWWNLYAEGAGGFNAIKGTWLELIDIDTSLKRTLDVNIKSSDVGGGDGTITDPDYVKAKLYNSEGTAISTAHGGELVVRLGSRDAKALQNTAISTMATAYKLYNMDLLYETWVSWWTSYGKLGEYNQFADGGISTGPDSGYAATLHGTELVVSPTSSYPVTLMNGGSTQQGEGEITINLQVVTPDGDITKEEVIKIARNEADYVRVIANDSPGNETRRIFQ